MKGFVVFRPGRAARSASPSHRPRWGGDDPSRDHSRADDQLLLATTPTWTRTASSLFTFTKQKAAPVPDPASGCGCYHVTDWDPEVVGARPALLAQGVGLRGPGNVEFKRDARDGRAEADRVQPPLHRAATGAARWPPALNLPLFIVQPPGGGAQAARGPPLQGGHRALVPAGRLPRLQGLPPHRRDDAVAMAAQPDAPPELRDGKRHRPRGRC